MKWLGRHKVQGKTKSTGSITTGGPIKLQENLSGSLTGTKNIQSTGALTLQASSGITGNITLDAGNDIYLNADRGDVVFKDDSAFLAKINSDGLSFVDNTGAGVIFEGTTDDAYNTTLTAADTTSSNKTITLPDATGTVALTQKTIVVDRASYWSSDTGSNPYYIPFDYFTESTSLSTASYRNFHVAPYDGRVVSIASFHQSSSTRTSTIEMYIDGDDSDLVADQRGSDLSSGSHGQKFQVDCPADWTFSKGEALAFRRTDNAATYGATMIIVFEYDITT